MWLQPSRLPPLLSNSPTLLCRLQFRFLCHIRYSPHLINSQIPWTSPVFVLGHGLTTLLCPAFGPRDLLRPLLHLLSPPSLSPIPSCLVPA